VRASSHHHYYLTTSRQNDFGFRVSRGGGGDVFREKAEENKRRERVL
jgi:hypothetical protein